MVRFVQFCICLSGQICFVCNFEFCVLRLVFDWFYGYYIIFDEGEIILILVEEVLLGDIFKIIFYVFVCLVMLLYLIFLNVLMDVYLWFCLNCLVWDNWEFFVGGKEFLIDLIDYQILQILMIWEEQFLGDYFGFFMKIGGNVFYLVFFFCVYNWIFLEWYCDQNLMIDVVLYMDDGLDLVGDYLILVFGKCKDYFILVLFWLQKGLVVQFFLIGNVLLVGFLFVIVFGMGIDVQFIFCLVISGIVGVFGMQDVVGDLNNFVI